MPSDVNGTNGEGAGARTATSSLMGDGGKKGLGPPSAGAAPLTLTSATDVEQLVRAQGSTFLVSDRSGNITPAGARELGLFHEDTRFLSHYTLDVGGGEVVRLSADTSHDGYNQIDLMLSDLDRGDILDDPKNFLHIRRRQMLDAGLVEQIVFTNFLQRRVVLDVSITFGADFADIFEVRGARRPQRGTAHPPRVSEAGMVFTYDGRCGTRYESVVTFTTPPADVKGTTAHYEVAIAAGAVAKIELSIVPRRDGDAGREQAASARTPSFTRRAARLEEDAARFRDTSTHVVCDDGRLQHVLDQSMADLHDLRVHFAGHSVLGAGIPWFCAPFGRDSLITSYEALLVQPELAEDSLRTLAAYQGKKADPVNEEEPGKIFHEMRFGEMARAGEIPHSPYYGSIDSTPLFVIVADAAHQVTANRALLRELRPAIEAALGWIDRRSSEGTELVAYARQSVNGLDNQGWKDSRAGVSFPDGRFAEPPIALAEVQGYCVDAYRRGARILSTLGDEAAAARYAARADAMRALVDDALWIEAQGRYAFAIDGRGRAVDTVVSNLGHLLWSRVATRARAAATARLLVAPASFSGYGIRTLAEGQPVYNPLSYHNGTVWPHDNAIAARGMSNYDLGAPLAKVFDGMYEAMGFFADRRLPELFCGMSRRSGPLVRYPVACSPQAWAAAAPFLLLQAMLGIHVDAPHARLVIRNPRLPGYVRRIELRRLRIGSSQVTVRFRRVGRRCQVDRVAVNGAPLRIEIEMD
jgi:glycogen debranching enzyme